ncbi:MULTISPECIES: BamA/TamA family outer membrane protein [unclassified Psychrobacter]|uniref:autotransporter assembly complex protein TamA n=1 Tax=unclassified Psychrobacter TaxID=196806 RepID=UPI0025B371A1|nr:MULTISPECIES: BamA/TamA family outer membrane protein [unclassified Psychrobacter]MDN3454041.1 BamA/TamA family outer membrane protein [Psychrobacter sp. APC 3350]MDN3501175.1 BamA/TamA family outer membrane protein [Psychrobacter sp. 5A.1]
MIKQPSTRARNVLMIQRDTVIIQNDSTTLRTRTAVPRIHFTRSALFTALATSLVGIAPAALADTINHTNTSNQSINNHITNNQTANAQAFSKQAVTLSEDDTQLDRALDALRLKKAVDQGIVDESVLDDYSEQSLGIKKSGSKKPTLKNPSTQDIEGLNGSSSTSYTQDESQANLSNDDLLQQAAAIQQQGYQMMTPEQIDRELAAMDRQNAQDIDSINGHQNRNNDSDFDAPIATLNDTASPIGLDVELDATNLPAPSNLDTLGRGETTVKKATTKAVSATDDVSDETVAGTNAPTNAEGTATDIINPNDYLPDYQNDTDASNQGIEQANRPKPRARNRGNIVKRLYNRLFSDGGVMALPNVETTIYIEQVAAEDAANGKAKLIEADQDIQPMKNIKAALEDTNVQSVIDFTAALPRLRETALNAAKAVGYYEVELRLTQPDPDTINVVIEELGEPVLVDSRIVEVRGAGAEQEEFATLETDLPPQEGDIFNHRVYKSSKAALESLSNTYGYFDQYWLNKSVDIILPDNKADVSLVYNTGDRYKFDDVVFFTYDKDTNTLTQDPDKLPVELSLLQQLYGFTPGDPFYRPAVTNFSNDLSATRYFNTVNVESILPPNDSSEATTLAFDNAATDGNGTLDADINNVDNAGIADLDSNAGLAASDVLARREDTVSDNSDIGGEGDNALSANSGETVNEADIAAIEFEADEATLDKLQAVKQKADRLSRLPNDRVLDEKDQEAENLLGKISDSISNVAQKIFPDEKSLLADENFVPPTLVGRKTPQEVAATKKVPLYVFVSANKPRDAQLGLGYGTDTGVRATAKIDYNLLNRQGYQAGAETEVSRINKNVAVYASRPWKHPLNDKLDARLTYEEEVIDQGKGNFDLSTQTLKAALARNIRRDNGWNRSYSVRYRLDKLETGVEGAALDDLPIRFTSSNPKQRALLFGYGMNKTSTDNATNPTRGIRQYYSIEAGTDTAFSDTDMAIVRAGVSGIYSFGDEKKHQVLGSVNAGYIWADDFYDVPYKLRFFAGGDQSIRGYDYESLSPLDKGYLTGGQVLAVGSAEYNYEFKPGFRGAFFTDVGNAYDKDFDTDTKVGVGVGIRWASPVGMVRVDVAAGVTEESIPIRLHFFIGSPL